MRKKFGKALSLALSGFLAAGSVGMTPLTAFAYDGTTQGPTQTITFEGDKPGDGDVVAYPDATYIATGSGTSVQTLVTDTGVPEDKTVTPNVEATTVYDVVAPTTQIRKPGHHITYWYIDNADTPVITVGTAATDGHKVYSKAFTGDKVTFSAKWVEDEFKLAYNYNGGTAASYGFTGTKKTYEAPIAAAVEDPSKTGYTFKGWDLDGNGKYDAATDIAPGEGNADKDVQSAAIDARYVEEQKKATPSDTVTLTAVWEGVDLTITSALTSDTFVTGNTPAAGAEAWQATKAFGTDFAKAVSDPTLKWYEFAGWDLDGDGVIGAKDIAPGATAAVQSKAIDDAYMTHVSNATVKPTAVWIPKVYTFTYVADTFDGGSLPSPTTVKYAEHADAKNNVTAFGADEKVAKVDVTRTGYTAGGWALGNSGIVIPKDTKISDIFDPNPSKVDGNLVDTLVKAGATEASVIAALKAAEQAKTATLNVKWDEDEYKVILNNGAADALYVSTNNDDNKWAQTTAGEKYTATLGLSKTIELPTEVPYDSVAPHGINSRQNNVSFDALNKTFVGWTTKPTGATADDVLTSNTITSALMDRNSEVNLYPYFVESGKYTLKFAKGTATAADGTTPTITGTMTDVEDVPYGETVTLPENKYAADHMQFKGFIYKGTVVADKSNVKVTSSETLTAKWEEDKYSVVYQNNGQKVGESKNNAYSSTLTTPVVSLDGKTLIGWDPDPNSTNPLIPLKNGATQAGFTGKTVNASNGDTVTLNAIYIATTDAVTVTFMENAGTGANDVAVTGGKNANITTLTEADFTTEAAAKTHYTLIGWTTEDPANKGKGFADEAAADAAVAAGKAKKYAAGSSEKFTENTSLYSLWGPETLTVKFDANGGTGTMADMSVTFTPPATQVGTGVYNLGILNENKFTKVGFKFDRWKVKGGTDTYTDQQNVTALEYQHVNRVVTLEAQWAEYEYTIAYDANSDTVTNTMLSTIVTSSQDKKTLRPMSFTNTDKTKEFAGWVLKENAGTATQAQFKDEDLATKVIEAANAADGATITLCALWKNTAIAEVVQEQAVATATNAAAAAAEPTAENIKALEDAIAEAKTAGVSDADLQAAQTALATAKTNQKTYEKAVSTANSKASALKDVTAPTDKQIKALEDAITAAEKAGASDKTLATAKAALQTALKKAKTATENDNKNLKNQVAAKKYVKKSKAVTADKKWVVNTFKNGTATLVKANAAKYAKGAVTLPASVKVGKVTYTVNKIADKAFYNNTTATSVVVPSSVVQIGKYAFGSKKAGKSKLKLVTIKGKRVFIGQYAFKNIPNAKKTKIKAADADTVKLIKAYGGQGKKVTVTK